LKKPTKEKKKCHPRTPRKGYLRLREEERKKRNAHVAKRVTSPSGNHYPVVGEISETLTRKNPGVNP